MITSIQGTLTTATPLMAVLEVNGLGYEVNVPVTTAERLPATGSTARLHTLVIYREDSQTLYGFATAEERDFFRLMVEKVTGVGPKVALSIMSRLSLPLLRSAIASGDVGTLAKCPGIGRKTAERLVVELKGHSPTLADTTSAAMATGSEAPGAAPSPQRDAVLALIALGYKTADADQVIRQTALALGPKATTEQLIKRALG
jgi:holliday junction DNA helicase RuvA